MGLNFFKKEKMTNSADLALMSVILPKSNKEYSIEKMVNALDEVELARDKPVDLDMSALVEVGDSKMTITELVAAYISLAAQIAELETEVEDVVDEDLDGDDDEEFENSEDDSDDDDDDDTLENEEESAAEKAKAKKAADALAKKKEDAVKNKKKNSVEEERLAKIKLGREKAERLKNAKNNINPTPPRVDTSMDQVARGKARYGS